MDSMDSILGQPVNAMSPFMAPSKGDHGDDLAMLSHDQLAGFGGPNDGLGGMIPPGDPSFMNSMGDLDGGVDMGGPHDNPGNNQHGLDFDGGMNGFMDTPMDSTIGLPGDMGMNQMGMNSMGMNMPPGDFSQMNQMNPPGRPASQQMNTPMTQMPGIGQSPQMPMGPRMNARPNSMMRAKMAKPATSNVPSSNSSMSGLGMPGELPNNMPPPNMARRIPSGMDMTTGMHDPMGMNSRPQSVSQEGMFMGPFNGHMNTPMDSSMTGINVPPQQFGNMIGIPGQMPPIPPNRSQTLSKTEPRKRAPRGQGKRASKSNDMSAAEIAAATVSSNAANASKGLKGPQTGPVTAYKRKAPFEDNSMPAGVPTPPFTKRPSGAMPTDHNTPPQGPLGSMLPGQAAAGRPPPLAGPAGPSDSQHVPRQFEFSTQNPPPTRTIMTLRMRVQLLLLLNQELLKIAIKAPRTSRMHATAMTRIEANLQYLQQAYSRQINTDSVLALAPPYLEALPEVPALNGLYERLNEVFRVLGTPGMVQ